MSSRGTMLAPVSKVKIEVKVNGEIRQADVDPRIPLVQLLRDELGLTGTHIGCLTGHCGACTVLLNGSAVKSCTVLAASANGDEIRTVEGLADGDLHPVQKAFLDHQGFQCGYCTPGMIMTTLELLRENPDPNDNEIKAGISGNLCRCTGYQTIIQAVRGAAEALRRNPHWADKS